jgi:hypothetical protein
MQSFSQNRIHGWDIKKITSVKIDFNTNEKLDATHLFNTRKDINAIISFLKEVDFRKFTKSEERPESSKHYCVLYFRGQRNQVYLFKNFALIGKTAFKTDMKVLQEFQKFVKELSVE